MITLRFSAPPPLLAFSGYAATFGRRTWVEELGCWEVVDRGAFREHLGNTVPLLVGHDASQRLADRCLLVEDRFGLFVEADIPPDRLDFGLGRRLKAGERLGMSFSATTQSSGIRWQSGERHIVAVRDLTEVSVTEAPAYRVTGAWAGINRSRTTGVAALYAAAHLVGGRP